MAPLLTVESVSVCHWRGRRPVQVLTGVSLDLEAGEFGGIWGDRSAGKTTLDKVVAGVLSPDEGRVTFDGRRLSETSRQDQRGALHAQIGLATRRGPEIEELPAEAWIASAMVNSCSWRTALRRSHVALERVGAADLAAEPWENLADGERMLVAIAEAIVRGPRLLVVDDPVAGVSAPRRAEIMDLLHSIAGLGVAVLMTAAELAELQGADRIWSLADGRLAGPPARPMGMVLPLRAGDARPG
ncbi:MAG TPA: ATP-binding cassette domain-containing protein [Baekduia sp.]|uniref:ATP-binding cassette domain-containing protein n=1 Tax=Baekduia sp. TaxID=2600305 RepID=UPI002BFD64AF|nr:ATP-binding cassette domain-containing protein [Baekduia sp.]HMJ33886.1 ATP-binding cassette domain-containing protein [Baekduia sp.]